MLASLEQLHALGLLSNQLQRVRDAEAYLGLYDLQRRHQVARREGEVGIVQVRRASHPHSLYAGDQAVEVVPWQGVEGLQPRPGYYRVEKAAMGKDQRFRQAGGPRRVGRQHDADVLGVAIGDLPREGWQIGRGGVVELGSLQHGHELDVWSGHGHARKCRVYARSAAVDDGVTLCFLEQVQTCGRPETDRHGEHLVAQAEEGEEGDNEGEVGWRIESDCLLRVLNQTPISSSARPMVQCWMSISYHLETLLHEGTASLVNHQVQLFYREEFEVGCVVLEAWVSQEQHLLCILAALTDKVVDHP